MSEKVFVEKCAEYERLGEIHRLVRDLTVDERAALYALHAEIAAHRRQLAELVATPESEVSNG